MFIGLSSPSKFGLWINYFPVKPASLLAALPASGPAAPGGFACPFKIEPKPKFDIAVFDDPAVTPSFDRSKNSRLAGRWFDNR
jgi:hypothetical protein